jgi:hypothetical protein
MIIQLGNGYTTQIDLPDYYKIIGHRWIANVGVGAVYAYAWINGASVYMHNLIRPPPDGMETDHIDRDGLNNRWNNLRVATRSQNMANRVMPNSSGYRGVSITPQGRYRTVIRRHGILDNLGTFDTIEEAARAAQTTSRGGKK